MASTGSPSMRTVPAAGLYTRVMTLKRVVLPAPLGPISATTWPASTANETRSRAITPPKRTLRSRTSSRAGIRVSRPRCSSHLRELDGRAPAALKPASRGPAFPRHASTMRSSSRHPFLGSGRRSRESASDHERGTLRHVAKVSVIDAHWMAVARGDEPADLVLSGGHVLSVFTKEWLDVDVAVKDGHVVGLGRYDGRERMDVAGAYLVPGFIDAHMHIESSKLTVDEFARAVLGHGTTAVVADPHEIANVLGTDGIHWLLDCCEEIPLDVFVMASSCVPASHFESPRRPFTTGDIESLLRRSRTIGIAEMMNFPGVIAGTSTELAKLGTGLTDHVDGHAPGVRGPALNAYIAAGIGTDHEAFTFEEALEKRRL